jgi:septal ring factor EnvC (AmiA/AmiB activator)
MSTAGKVLVVLVMLASLAWIILAAGVAQLNRNGNQLLDKLAKDLEQAETDLQATRQQTMALRDETALTQEKVDRDLALLRTRVADMEEARSDVIESLTRVQSQLATVEETIKRAQASLEHRTKERQDEEKALSDLRNEVQGLSTTNDQLAARLQTLRDRFNTNYHANLEMLGGRQ